MSLMEKFSKPTFDVSQHHVLNVTPNYDVTSRSCTIFCIKKLKPRQLFYTFLLWIETIQRGIFNLFLLQQLRKLQLITVIDGLVFLLVHPVDSVNLNDPLRTFCHEQSVG